VMGQHGKSMGAGEVSIYLLALMCLLPVCFAGMAFPVPESTYAQDMFRKINPAIEWDPTNFLVDLSGPYTLCKYSDHYGPINVYEVSKDGGSSIGGYIETIKSSGHTVTKAGKDIRVVIAGWIKKNPFKDQIREAKLFGCSIQPSCPNGRSVIGCLFSPKFQGNQPRPTNPGPIVKQKALAFTSDQYELAAKVTQKRWDRSHLLENLSGYETDCDMINQRYHDFADAKAMASKRGIKVIGKFGSAPLKGDTTEAVSKIIRSWNLVNAKMVGCSAIPDCTIFEKEMTTVVSCIFSL
ncbi:unnamed protein product, partial [Owenia fusiformis]